MDISVVMSVFNSEKTINQSVESILSQTYTNFKFLIVDDCSTDKTFEILKFFEKKDKRITVFKNSNNIGLTKSLNFLLSKVNSQLIARQDGDDISLNNRLSTQFKFLNSNMLDACTTRAIIKDSNKIVPNISFYISPKLLINIKNPFIHGTLLIKTKVIKEIGGYNEKFIYAQDYKLMKDLIENKFKVRILKQPLYQLNMNNNISTLFKNEQKYYANCVKNNIVPY